MSDAPRSESTAASLARRADTETRFVLCGHCGSEGRLYHGFCDDGWSEICPTCKGECCEEVEVFLIDLDDLDALAELDREAAP